MSQQADAGVHLQKPARFDAKPIRVLCVDGDSENCRMLETLLGFENIELVSVHCPDECWKFIRSENFDLYLIDSFFSRPTKGFELCRKIRAFDVHKPIVIFTADVRKETKKMMTQCGADTVLCKPADLEKLPATILSLVGSL